MREKGFTLIEILVGMAIGSMILTGILLTIHAILVTNVDGNKKVTALTDVSGAALALKNDLMMAQNTDLVDGVPEGSIDISWYDYTSSFGSSFQTFHTVSYNLVGRELQRTYDDEISIVGRNVTSVSFTQSVSGYLKSVAVVISTSGSTQTLTTETLNFSVHMRSEEAE
jgi:prepilin-type N-terminal cleavage/methylation domain-containing protein